MIERTSMAREHSIPGIDARFLVEKPTAVGASMDVIIKAAGGGRNRDYDLLVTALLRAVRRFNGSIEAIALDSNSPEARKLAPEERILSLRYPLRITASTDTEALRKRIGNEAKKTARKPGSKNGGNSQKRIRLSLSLPMTTRTSFVASLESDRTNPLNSSFLLVWSPKVFAEKDWETLEKEVALTENGELVEGNWSLGSRKTGIEPGDHVFLLRQHDFLGIVAHGTVKGRKGDTIYQSADFKETERSRRYIDVMWERVLSPRDGLPISSLKRSIPDVNWDRVQGSGYELALLDQRKILQLWNQHLARLDTGSSWVNPSDMEGAPKEGRRRAAKSYEYERSKKARAMCLAKHGYDCSVCGFSFSRTYGAHGANFIVVHHLRPLAAGDGTNKAVDPERDLRPVCCNCHSMLHRTEDPTRPLSIAELKRILNKSNPKH